MFNKKQWFNRPNKTTPIDASGMNDLENRASDEFNNINSKLSGLFPSIRTINGITTGVNTSITFPTGWDGATPISVLIVNANNVWININTIYVNNSGAGFYFTHDSGLGGRSYRVLIAKNFNL